MKRAFLLAVMVVAALLATSCQKEEMGRILTATIEQYEHNAKGGNGGVVADSKAYINSDYYACWEAGDLVSINGTRCTVSVSKGDEHNYSATIQGEIPTDEDLMAFYPADMVNNLSATGGTVTLPQVQTYREQNGHQIINNPMAAYCSTSSNELKFRNLCALLKVTIQASAGEDLPIRAISVKGNNNQMLWGTAPLQLDTQHKTILGEMTNGSNWVQLYFETPVEISAGAGKSFYVVVPAGSNFFDFTISVATSQKTYIKTSKVGQTLPRNHIGALTYTPAEADEVCAILYTGSIEGFRSDAFGGAQVVSNEGGILIFDGFLTSIGERAFDDCSGLTSVTIPNSVTTIGSYALRDCSGLASISLPAGVTSIGNSAFYGCSGLTSISLPAGVTTIGDYTFYGCSGLTSISLPAGVTSIGYYAFYCCTNLTTVYVNRWVENGDPKITPFGTGMFNGCTSLSDIYVPAGAVTAYQEGWGTSYSDKIQAMPDNPLP